ncbi:MAG: ABC transporter substrate-binding protein [Bacteroidia bacterium]|nr:ABC transporter substrate-binding protein [Bacteroidia bacterium]
MKYLKFFIPFTLIVAILFNAGCNKDDDDDTTTTTKADVYLGVILPMDKSSGPFRENAVNTIVDEINAGGGVMGGHLIKTDIRSSEATGTLSREDQAAVIANAILSDHSSELVGFVTSFSSSSKGVALQVADGNKIPQISGSSTANSNSNISSYFQRLAPSDKFQSLVLSKKAIEYGITKVAIAVQTGDVFSEGLAQQFKEKFIADGGTITDSVSFLESDPDYITKLTTLYSGNPDAVFTAILSIDVEFLNNVKDNATVLGLNTDSLRFIFSDAQKTDNILTQAPPEFLTGVINGNPRAFGANAFPDTTSGSYIHFQSELKTRYSQDVESFNAQFYDIIYVFALSMERAVQDGASIDDMGAFRIAVNDNIRKVSGDDSGESTANPQDGWSANQTAAKSGDVNYEGASGNCDIDSNGDVVTNYDVYKIVDDGTGTLSFVTIENISPN